MIRVLIVDDSSTETAILKHLLESSPEFHVVGCAKNGAEAIKLVALLKPDLITMDIQMPVMDGIEATKIIMEQYPTPIVMISTKATDKDFDATFKGLNAGALSVLPKPFNVGSSESKLEQQHIMDTIRIMSGINVIKRRPLLKKTMTKPPLSPKKENQRHHQIIVIGASIGGTQALNVILSPLPKNFPVPILVVQHIMPGYISGYTKWLDGNIHLLVGEMKNNEPLLPGRVYFAPDASHSEVQRSSSHLACKLTKSPTVSGFCPSITVLFESVAKVCGSQAIGVLLTGMGDDGANGLLAIKNTGGHTIIQDKESCIVFGMASVAKELGAVDTVVKLDQIANYLMQLCPVK
jgi:two-component system chemotaxis response regulator CheB